MLAQYNDMLLKQIYTIGRKMADIKNDSTIRIYRDGKPEDVPVNVFLRMLEELKAPKSEKPTK